MRLQAAALAMSALILSACGGGDTPANGASAPAGDASASASSAPATPASITGTTHDVLMLGDERGYRYEPAELTVSQGDGVRFVMVSGAPHNVEFERNGIPAGSAAQLSANISDKMSELASNMYLAEGDEVTVSFANVPAGEYNIICTPHLPMGMRGKVTVQ